MKEIILKVAAHQLRSPIATIQTQLKTILAINEGELSGKVKRLIEGACRKSDDMLDLLNDLLEMSKIEDENVKNQFSPFNLEQLFQDVIENLTEKAEIKDIDFQIDKKDIFPFVWGYSIGIKHILHNLIENAIKYTPSGGRVYVNIYYHKGTLYAEIKDTGIGIPKEDGKNIFLEFYRASNAKSESKIGTGLGLPIVLKAIEIHGGKIEYESKVGEGTGFNFSIPLMEIEEKKFLDLSKNKLKEELGIVIIGGRSAGPKAAAKARRMKEDASITIIEKDKSLSYAGCALPYYISGMILSPKSFMATNDGDLRDQEFFRKIKDIKVLNRTKAISIDRDKKELFIRDLNTNEKSKISYDKLILATGSKCAIPKIKGVTKKGVYTLHKVEDAEGLKNELRVNKARDVIIIGGGILGAETAEALSIRGSRVTIIEAGDQILRFLDKEIAFLIQNYFETQGVRILLNQKVEAIEGDDFVRGIKIGTQIIPADLIILSTGVRPEVSLARNCGLHIGSTGAIKVNEYLQTSDPDIYAIGDCVENISIITGKPVYTPFGSIATRHGRVAGINVTGKKEIFAGVLKTIIMKIFNYNVGSVGLNERQAMKEGFEPLSVIVPASDSDYFYPGAKLIYVKLVADSSTRRILGCQVIGRGAVSKRIDIISTAISAKMTVSDVSRLDLAYAPPYSSAMDILITAANVLNNKCDGNYVGISPLELKLKLDREEDILLLDVRTHNEYDYMSIPSSVHMPLNSLRGRLPQLPVDREIIICCRSGVNSYEALRILKAKGFKNVKVLEGGILTFLGEVS